MRAARWAGPKGMSVVPTATVTGAWTALMASMVGLPGASNTAASSSGASRSVTEPSGDGSRPCSTYAASDAALREESGAFEA